MCIRDRPELHHKYQTNCQLTFQLDAPVLLRVRVKLSRGTSQEPINCEVPWLSFTLTLKRTGASSWNVGKISFFAIRLSTREQSATFQWKFLLEGLEVIPQQWKFPAIKIFSHNNIVKRTRGWVRLVTHIAAYIEPRVHLINIIEPIDIRQFSACRTWYCEWL